VRKIFSIIAALILQLGWTGTGYAAVDSYRYLHVTVETPWTIFLILLPMVLAPLILMGVLVWRYAERKTDSEEQQDQASGRNKE
jgi:membrane protein DedA with SNARE-associated domain